MSSPFATGDNSVPCVTRFHVTGFGEFHGVTNNPTEQLIATLPAYLEAHPLPNTICLDSLTVLEVSAVGSRETLHTLAPCDAVCKDTQRRQRQVFLHFGVHDGSTQFKLESTAYNCADFRVPDQREWTPKNELILPDCPGELRTNIDVDTIARKLSRAPYGPVDPAIGAAAGWKCIVSTDPGRYVCNWIYFNSQHRAASFANSSVLFVHVPSHLVYDLAAQQQFARDVFIEIARTLDEQEKLSAKTSTNTTAEATAPIIATA